MADFKVSENQTREAVGKTTHRDDHRFPLEKIDYIDNGSLQMADIFETHYGMAGTREPESVGRLTTRSTGVMNRSAGGSTPPHATSLQMADIFETQNRYAKPITWEIVKAAYDALPPDTYWPQPRSVW